MSDQTAAVVLAAGKSTRMKSDLPKVLHRLCGLPMLHYVLAALDEAGVRRKIVVVGFRGEMVRQAFAHWPGVEFVEQSEQKGTGHAVMVCREALADHAGPIVVLAGDAPFIRGEMIATMLARQAEQGAQAFLATAVMPDPFGMGRIVRDEDGSFAHIVEQKDATPTEAAITEVNGSFYAFDGPALFSALEAVVPKNAQGEYYVTDVPQILRKRGQTIVAETLADSCDVFGINHRRHLGDAHALMQRRIQDRHLEAGITIVDPSNTYIDAQVTIGRDTVIEPFTVIHGPSEIGQRCRIGPFAHVREGCRLADEVSLGAFVEAVRTEMGHGATARHLAYLGDASLGNETNVGAGLVTANFDGVGKNKTMVGNGAFLGSGAVLVAPVSVGDQAVVGAGAVVTKNHPVAPGQIVVGVPARPLRLD